MLIKLKVNKERVQYLNIKIEDSDFDYVGVTWIEVLAVVPRAIAEGCEHRKPIEDHWLVRTSNGRLEYIPSFEVIGLIEMGYWVFFDTDEAVLKAEVDEIRRKDAESSKKHKKQTLRITN